MLWPSAKCLGNASIAPPKPVEDIINDMTLWLVANIASNTVLILVVSDLGNEDVGPCYGHSGT